MIRSPGMVRDSKADESGDADGGTLFWVRDVFDFVETSRVILLSMTVVGALAAGGYGVWKRQVTAEIVLANQGATPISFTLWAQMRQALPPMAAAIDQLRLAEGRELDRTPWLSSPAWWATNVEPVLALSRDDARMLASVGEDMKGASTRIMTFRVRYAAKSADEALRGAEASAAFMGTGSLYLELKSLLNSYQAESLTQASQRATAELLKTDVEIAFSRSKAHQLEAMLKSGPAASGSPQLIVDVGQQAQAKFLPLQTQLNAVRLEIAQLEETKTRLLNTQNRGRLLAEFQTRSHAALAALPLGDGVAASDAMIKIAGELRGSIDGKTEEARLSQSETIARILSDVTALRTRYVVELPEVSRSYGQPSWTKTVVMAAAGAVGATIGGILLLLFHREYQAYRSELS